MLSLSLNFIRAVAQSTEDAFQFIAAVAQNSGEAIEATTTYEGLPGGCVDVNGVDFTDGVTMAADFNGQWELIMVSRMVTLFQDFVDGGSTTYSAGEEGHVNFKYESGDDSSSGEIYDLAPGQLHQYIHSSNYELPPDLFEINPEDKRVTNFCVIYKDDEIVLVADRSRYFAWVSISKDTQLTEEIRNDIIEIAEEYDIELVDLKREEYAPYAELRESLQTLFEIEVRPECVDEEGDNFTDGKSTVDMLRRSSYYLYLVGEANNMLIEYGNNAMAVYTDTEDMDTIKYSFHNETGPVMSGFVRNGSSPGTFSFHEPGTPDSNTVCMIEYNSKFSFMTDTSRTFAWVTTTEAEPSQKTLEAIDFIASSMDLHLTPPK